VKKEKDNVAIRIKHSPTCQWCWGRGWLSFIHPTDSRMREVRPCYCVKAVVKAEIVEDSRGKEAEQRVVDPT
jgi:hypothetical protein